MSQLEKEIKELVDSAPIAVKGRRPTEEEIEEQTLFKTRVKEFIENIPEGVRVDGSGDSITYKYIADKVKERQIISAWGVRIKTKRKGNQPNPNTTITQSTNNEKNKRKPKHAKADYLCVLDFEATCNDKGPGPSPQEIIEFPTLLLNVENGKVEDVFHYYIRPDVHPQLSSFCTELTGITQETVDAGISLKETLQLHNEWLFQKHNLLHATDPSFVEQNDTNNNNNNNAVEEENEGDGCMSSKRFLYVTCGSWDLKTCLPRQLDHLGIPLDKHFQSYVNIKWSYEKQYKTKAFGMTGMLKDLGIELEGRHHSGIDDCKNIAKICRRMLQDGWIPEANSR
jgi:ERI1 exoribonuclease 3